MPRAKPPAPAALKASAKASAKSTTQPASSLPLATLSELANWLNTTPLEEVELEQAGLRVRLKKPSVGTALGTATPLAAPAPTAAPVAEAPTTTIKSPMVGTFYHASGPDAAPFVQEGDTVAIGQTIGIIEAMKTMNQITADHAGKVAKILTANGQPVEFGQPLIQLV